VESSGVRSHSTGLRWNPWSPTGMGGALISTEDTPDIRDYYFDGVNLDESTLEMLETSEDLEDFADTSEDEA
jgi:hypothetical protein